MISYLVMFVGAGIGGMMRHGVNVGVMRLLGTSFPYATLTVNILGSLVLGLLAGYFAFRTGFSQTARLFLTTGVIGGFTTFSAFSLETVLLYERGEIGLATAYVAASVAGAVAALALGLLIARALS